MLKLFKQFLKWAYGIRKDDMRTQVREKAKEGPSSDSNEVIMKVVSTLAAQRQYTSAALIGLASTFELDLAHVKMMVK